MTIKEKSRLKLASGAPKVFCNKEEEIRLSV